MKGFNLLKLAAALCVVAMLACGVVLFFRTTNIGISYADAGQYTAGGAELAGPVRNLDVDWLDGSVIIAYHAKDTVVISETAPKPISGDDALRWWLDGDTLRVRYAKPGLFSLRSLFSFKGLNKALTLTLPEGAALENIDIDVTSGAVNVPELNAGNVDIDMTSGELALRQSGAAERVALSATSGSISADLAEVGKLAVSITSGVIRTTVDSAKEISLSTTSGDIALRGGAAQKTDIDSTSGRIDVALAAFDELRVSATSGDIEAALPTDPGYSADINTTSGSFNHTVELSRDGKRYTCGDGSAQLRIDATSGDVRLTDANGQRP